MYKYRTTVKAATPEGSISRTFDRTSEEHLDESEIEAFEVEMRLVFEAGEGYTVTEVTTRIMPCPLCSVALYLVDQFRGYASDLIRLDGARA